jgi:hypothetical protein
MFATSPGDSTRVRLGGGDVAAVGATAHRPTPSQGLVDVRPRAAAASSRGRTGPRPHPTGCGPGMDLIGGQEQQSLATALRERPVAHGAISRLHPSNNPAPRGSWPRARRRTGRRSSRLPAGALDLYTSQAAPDVSQDPDCAPTHSTTTARISLMRIANSGANRLSRSTRPTASVLRASTTPCTPEAAPLARGAGLACGGAQLPPC